MRGALLLLAGLACASAQAAEGTRPEGPRPEGPRIETLKQIGPALQACWRPPEAAHPFQVTIRVSFNRDGGVIGKPAVSFSQFTGGDEDRARVAEAVAGALRSCSPLPFSKTLGAAVAGRIFVFRFGRTAPAVAI